MTELPTTWLTQEAFDRLTDELAFLKSEGRAKVTAKIAQAREEGDLSENGGYHAAREEQGHQEARIRQLTAMLENVQVGEAPVGSEQVTPGSEVTVYYDDDPDDTDTFLLGSRELMNLDDSVNLEVFSPQSPLGKAILGHKVGDTVRYNAPNGRKIDVTVARVAAFGL
ncbi:MAG: transcription elongation factor GreA [Propionibacteriaceae bacterium]|nr:transcription elongation factor GreA [Propionibacteriaceae bacterium]